MVDRPLSFFFGEDEPLRSDADSTAREFLDRTVDFWRDWVRSLSIPFEWQEAVIRAAITLKLCNFEETGAIVAAADHVGAGGAHTQRNWDYRFCWLRDAYFVIQALNRLGTTGTMEEYLNYITNIVDDSGGGSQPERHAAALQHHPVARARGATGRGARGLSRHGAGPHRQCAPTRRSRTMPTAASCWPRPTRSSTGA